MTTPRSMLLRVAAGATLLLATAAGAQVPDHLRCYQIKDALRLGAIIDLDTAPFGLEGGCTISSPKMFCLPASKTVVSATDKATRTPITPLPYSSVLSPEGRLCYKVRCPSPILIADQQATDQFGVHTLSHIKAKMMCTPATRGVAYCGDGAIDPGEQCDGANLGGATCVSLGYTSGALACAAGCGFDTGGCASQAFPATGQTTCWNSSGTPIACPGTGHDGALQAGATLAYVDNGNGTITDANTGLQWEKLSDDGGMHDRDTTFTWDAAFTGHVATLNASNFAGHNDWRMPNVRELESIINHQNVSPAVSAPFNTGCLSGCTVSSCSCTASSFYWSSTTYANSLTRAWFVLFSDGVKDTSAKSNASFVRAVRGGS